MQLDESEILRRGLDTFAELGYAATTVRELARRLDASHNFINDRYGSKENFWRAAVDFALRDAQPALNQLLTECRDDDERLRKVVVQLYRLAANASGLNRLMSDESTRDSSRLDYLHQRFVKPFWDSIEPTVNSLMATGRIPRVAGAHPLLRRHRSGAGPGTGPDRRPAELLGLTDGGAGQKQHGRRALRSRPSRPAATRARGGDRGRAKTDAPVIVLAAPDPEPNSRSRNRLGRGKVRRAFDDGLGSTRSDSLLPRPRRRSSRPTDVAPARG